MTAVDDSVKNLLDDVSRPDVSMGWLLCDRHPRDGSALWFVDEDGTTTTLTFGELADRSRRIAAVLAGRGVRPGDRVATLMGKSPDLLCVAVAIWRLGAVYVPLFTAFAPDAVVDRVTRADCRVAVTDTTQAAKLAALDGRTIFVRDAPVADASSLADLTGVEPLATDEVGDGATPIVQMFTSGTTGAPKAVVHPRSYVAGWLAYDKFGLGIPSDAVFWCAADPGWALGLYAGIVAPLAIGRPILMVQGGFDPRKAWETIDAHRVTDLLAAPTVYRAMLAVGPADDWHSPLERLTSAGEPLTDEVLDWARRRLGRDVHDQYGQTETGMLAGFPHHPAVQRDVEPQAMGTALPGWTLDVLRFAEDKPAEPGELGRLAVRVADSPLMTFTSYVEAERSADRFTRDGAYYLTGDMARRTPDGLLRFNSRDDDVIIMAGYRIGPFDVESVLLRHPAVAECAVTAAPDAERGEVLVAHVVTGPGATADDALVAELQQWVKTKYAAHAYPRRVTFVDALPKTPSGKIQRHVLRAASRAEGVS